CRWHHPCSSWRGPGGTPTPMELVIRKYFWAVNLCFVALAALLAAKTVNLFLEAAIAPAAAAPAARVAARPSTPDALASLDVNRLSTYPGIPLPPPDLSTDEPTPDLSGDPVKTSLRIKLLGTLVSTAPGWSIASLLDTTNQRSQTVMVG